MILVPSRRVSGTQIGDARRVRIWRLPNPREHYFSRTTIADAQFSVSTRLNRYSRCGGGFHYLGEGIFFGRSARSGSQTCVVTDVDGDHLKLPSGKGVRRSLVCRLPEPLFEKTSNRGVGRNSAASGAARHGLCLLARCRFRWPAWLWAGCSRGACRNHAPPATSLPGRQQAMAHEADCVETPIAGRRRTAGTRLPAGQRAGQRLRVNQARSNRAKLIRS